MQTIEIKVEFQVHHTPDNESHLRQVAESYLRGKGVRVENNIIKV